VKYIVAVSGGVDSVVLLDMLVHQGEHELIVGHFDHGIRDDSAADARFVEELAKKYELPYETKREELGANASEEIARERRYDFLDQLAKKHNAQVVTAHHHDDLLETIAINSTRGTGWRGLAVLGNANVARPLLAYTKSQLYDYALSHNLEWVEDETNQSQQYLRNQIRKKIAGLDDGRKIKLKELWYQQSILRDAIDKECAELLETKSSSRYFYTMIDEAAAIELLRAELLQKSMSLPRPQRQRLLMAIKTASAGSQHQPGGRGNVEFTKREFIVKQGS